MKRLPKKGNGFGCLMPCWDSTENGYTEYLKDRTALTLCSALYKIHIIEETWHKIEAALWNLHFNVLYELTVNLGRYDNHSLIMWLAKKPQQEESESKQLKVSIRCVNIIYSYIIWSSCNIIQRENYTYQYIRPSKRKPRVTDTPLVLWTIFRKSHTAIMSELLKTMRKRCSWVKKLVKTY